MSKLEEAIRKAGESNERARTRRIIDNDTGVSLEDTSGTLSRLVPVPYQLRAECRHTPSVKALEKHRIIHEGYSDDALASYKMLRTRILQQYNANDWRTLAITAPHDGAGKTVTAINLAITLASHGDHEIFLIDADLRNPAIADCLDLPAEFSGLTSYLDDDADLPSVLWGVGVDNLAVVANRKRVTNSSDLLTSKRMRALIKTFKSTSLKPIVIFDLPPVLTADDAVAISPYVDGMIMVASERETPRDALFHALDLLRGANVLGVVLNKTGGR